MRELHLWLKEREAFFVDHQPFLVQWSAVTVTPLGTDKTLTVTDCHSILRYSIICKTNWGMQKLSL